MRMTPNLTLPKNGTKNYNIGAIEKDCQLATLRTLHTWQP